MPLNKRNQNLFADVNISISIRSRISILVSLNLTMVWSLSFLHVRDHLEYLSVLMQANIFFEIKRLYMVKQNY